MAGSPTLGYFLGGVVDERARQRTIGIQERQVGLGEAQLVEEQRQNTIKQVQGTVKQAREMILKMKADFAGTAEEFNAQLSGKVKEIIGQVNQTATMAGVSGLGNGFMVEMDQTPTALEKAQQGASVEAAGVRAKVAAAGNDPVMQESLGVAPPKLDVMTLTNPSTRDWVTIPDPSSPAGRAKVARLTAAGYVEGSLSLQAQKSSDISGLKEPGTAEAGKFRDFQVATLTALDILDELQQEIGSSQTVTGFAETAFSALTGAAGSAQQLAKMAGGFAEINGEMVNEGDLLDPSIYDFGMFKDEAMKTGAFKSNMITLAYLRARSLDPSGRVSDADVQNMLKTLGGESGNKNFIIGALDAVRRQLIRSARGRHKRMKQSVPGLAPLDERLSGGSTSKVDALLDKFNKDTLTQEDLNGLTEDEKKELARKIGIDVE